ncbi:MAG: GNAT family N-acetyltransferase [Proteobacteria bacterium]|nr:GNAT family N-acetyltransferase [Cystobacterineae bacterium]MCL2258230.1 GNAT family N-acetyltransferase [Cystobacterineae bacterium]MCL2315391.1 GNAT family N-acetyltransferase [Pseudomonadota bacterium]
MTTNPQDAIPENLAATPGVEKGGESLPAWRFGLPTDEELPGLARLYAANIPFEDVKPQETLEKFIRLRERIQVVRADGQVLGFVTIEPNGPVRGAAFLRHLVVKPEHRRRGVGASLLKQAYHVALGMSRKSLILRVDPSDEDVVAFVRKAGFMTVGAQSSKKSGKLRLLMSHEL